MRRLNLAAIAVAATLFVTNATAADRIRLAVQRTGTLAWELDIIQAHGLDRKFNLAIERVELASTEAGKIALKGGSADLMLSDWLWVARERSLGDKLVFYPSSSTLGAVMVPANSPIKGIADLKGRKLAVAGGPLDKSWLLLQALALRSGLDLRKQATIVYGAPPLLTQKALQGEHDATLTFWNFCAASSTHCELFWKKFFPPMNCPCCEYSARRSFEAAAGAVVVGARPERLLKARSKPKARFASVPLASIAGAAAAAFFNTSP